MSRCVRDGLEAGCRATVCGVQRRACHLAVEHGRILVLSGTEVPLGPNAVAVAVAPHVTLVDAGFRVGQVVALDAMDPADDDAEWADWHVALGEASTWEPRPRVHAIARRALADRLRVTRATVIAEGAGAPLLPLLWVSETDVLQPRVLRAAGGSTRRLLDAALHDDAASVADAARGLGGLGPGLTPSGDDLLAGLIAAWVLVGEALDLGRAGRERMTAALFAGAEPGASPLGRAWLDHARRGELPEPMTRFVAVLLSVECRDPDAAARGVLTVGSSSGTDWMVGFLLGAGTLIERVAGGRRW